MLSGLFNQFKTVPNRATEEIFQKACWHKENSSSCFYTVLFEYLKYCFTHLNLFFFFISQKVSKHVFRSVFVHVRISLMSGSQKNRTIIQPHSVTSVQIGQNFPPTPSHRFWLMRRGKKRMGDKTNQFSTSHSIIPVGVSAAGLILTVKWDYKVVSYSKRSCTTASSLYCRRGGVTEQSTARIALRMLRSRTWRSHAG